MIHLAGVGAFVFRSGVYIREDTPIRLFTNFGDYLHDQVCPRNVGKDVKEIAFDGREEVQTKCFGRRQDGQRIGRPYTRRRARVGQSTNEEMIAITAESRSVEIQLETKQSRIQTRFRELINL